MNKWFFDRAKGVKSTHNTFFAEMHTSLQIDGMACIMYATVWVSVFNDIIVHVDQFQSITLRRK